MTGPLLRTLSALQNKVTHNNASLWDFKHLAHHYEVSVIYPVGFVLPPLHEFALQQLPHPSRGSKLLHYILGLVELFFSEQVLHAPQVHVQGVLQGRERQLRETLSSVCVWGGGDKKKKNNSEKHSVFFSEFKFSDTCILMYQEPFIKIILTVLFH